MAYVCCYKSVKIMEAKLEMTFKPDQFEDIERVLYILVNEGWDMFEKIEYKQSKVVTSIKLVLTRKLWE